MLVEKNTHDECERTQVKHNLQNKIQHADDVNGYGSFPCMYLYACETSLLIYRTCTLSKCQSEKALVEEPYEGRLFFRVVFRTFRLKFAIFVEWFSTLSWSETQGGGYFTLLEGSKRVK